MNFALQFALATAVAALHTVIRKFGKYLTPEELTAADLLIDALGEMPQRIDTASKAAETPPPGIPPDTVKREDQP